jgi:glc operon protein GlcG
MAVKHGSVLALALAMAPLGAGAQMMPNPYGPNIGLALAKKAAAGAMAEARKNNWNMAAAVVDTAGNLVYFERMDNTQSGSIRVAQEKARTSAQFKRPSKAFEDAVPGRQAILGLPGATPIEGGLPILSKGAIIGAIGLSGGTSPQDGQCAAAGVNAVGGASASAPQQATGEVTAQRTASPAK